MGARRDGREAAVQYFYQKDLSGENSPGTLQEFYGIRTISPSARKFCTKLVQGVTQNETEVDELIRASTKNYELSRLSAVDRNILRLATFEMMFCPEVPPAVSISEAIEIAKKYSTEESGRFVNGVLDNIRIHLDSVRPPNRA